jgi:hypothetical protein
MSYQTEKSHQTTLKVALIAGAISGAMGLFGFGVIHAIIIVPIWWRLFGGLPVALAGGALLGWALFEARNAGRLTRPVTSGLWFGVLLWLMLIPMTAVGNALRVYARNGGGRLPEGAEIALDCFLAFLSGALAGWLIGRRWRVALAFSSATLALALAMGGPIAVTNSARAAWLFLGFLGVYAIVGLMLTGLVGILACRIGRRHLRHQSATQPIVLLNREEADQTQSGNEPLTSEGKLSSTTACPELAASPR